MRVCVCVWTEMECEWCLFGHGSKPDGKVWVIAAVGDDIMNIHRHVCVTISSTVLLGEELMLH